jgi:hypothetical protein
MERCAVLRLVPLLPLPDESDVVPEPTSLYRHFNKDGLLLYVGISLGARALDRQVDHRGSAKWFCEISNITLEHLPSREAARIAEDRAILVRRIRPCFMTFETDTKFLVLYLTSPLATFNCPRQRPWQPVRL